MIKAIVNRISKNVCIQYPKYIYIALLYIHLYITTLHIRTLKKIKETTTSRSMHSKILI